MRKRILISATNFSVYCAEAKKILEENGYELYENEYGRPMTVEERLPYLEDTVAAIANAEIWDEQIFSKAPRMRIVTRFGVGYDNFNLDDATRYGVKMCHARGMNALSVAEFAVAMILNAVKGIPYLDKTTREGKWERFMGRDIAGKTVGLIGYGAIARYVAGMLRGFNIKLLAYDPYPDKAEAERQGVILTSCDNLLRTSDIVSLHLPCNSETYHFMNDRTFDIMKDGSYLVNTARGAVIDSDALYRALVSGKLSGASLDVYEQEPTRKDNPLFSLPNVICTPHSAAETYETYSRVSLCCVRQILAEARGEVPEFLLNPEVLRKI